MNKSVLIAIIASAIIVPGIVYAISPYFTATTIDEPSPVATSSDGAESMEKDDTVMEDDAMGKNDDVMMEDTMKKLSGGFDGAGDGIHNASGKATVLYPEDGSAILRLENFRVTNGPDLYIYLSADKSASDYVDLGRLKANSGNQNYELPDGVNVSKYDTVVIWCKAFNVYFGSAELRST